MDKKNQGMLIGGVVLAGVGAYLLTKNVKAAPPPPPPPLPPGMDDWFVTAMNAPAEVEPDAEFQITVTVNNPNENSSLKAQVEIWLPTQYPKPGYPPPIILGSKIVTVPAGSDTEVVFNLIADWSGQTGIWTKNGYNVIILCDRYVEPPPNPDWYVWDGIHYTNAWPDRIESNHKTGYFIYEFNASMAHFHREVDSGILEDGDWTYYPGDSQYDDVVDETTRLYNMYLGKYGIGESIARLRSKITVYAEPYGV